MKRGIRIVGNGSILNTRVLDAEGNDLTERLRVRSILFAHAAGQLPTALLECLVAEIDAEVPMVKAVSDSDLVSGEEDVMIEGELLRRIRRLEYQNRQLQE